jgi:hypothetical protein
MKHSFNNLMKYSSNASSSPAIRVEVKGNEVLIYVRSIVTCPCCHQVTDFSGESLFRTMSLAQYKAIIERDRLTL